VTEEEKDEGKTAEQKGAIKAGIYPDIKHNSL
jgi:hypothetical protein